MGGSFEALTRHPESLRTAIERLRPTLDEAVASFPVAARVLVGRGRAGAPPRAGGRSDGGVASRHVVCAAHRHAGARRRRRRSTSARATCSARSTTSRPTRTRCSGLKDLRRTFEVTTPLLEYIAPYQSVCNYWTLYWTALSEHVSEEVTGGTLQRTNLKSDSRIQDNRLSDSGADRPVDVKPGDDPQTAREVTGDPRQALHRGAYEPAIDAQGNADCQVGQRGYLKGPLTTGNRYGHLETGGRNIVLDSDLPGLSGATQRMRELGIKNLRDVP